MDCSLYSGPKKELDSGNYWERGEGPGRGRKLGGIRRRAETKLMEEWKENVKRIRKRSEFVVHESECVMIIIYKLRN